MNDARAREILGVPSNATLEECRKKYLRLCLQHHPDRGGSAERFKEIQNAYAFLFDDEKGGATN